MPANTRKYMFNRSVSRTIYIYSMSTAVSISNEKKIKRNKLSHPKIEKHKEINELLQNDHVYAHI